MMAYDFSLPMLLRMFPQSQNAGDSVSEAQVSFPIRQPFSQESSVTKEGFPAPEETELPRDYTKDEL
jgi:hypothetical protein